MSITIYSVVTKRLIEDAKRIEKHAEDQLEAWIALGQSDKYAKAIEQARLLRIAANGKDAYSRRAFLKISGFTIKNLDKTPKENPVDDLPIWARPRPGRLGAAQPLTAAQKRTAKARAAAAGRKYPNLIDNIAAARNPTMKPASPAQLAARKRFAEMVRSGAFKKATKRKANPAKKTVSQKISQLVHEGYPQRQAVAVALSEQRAGKVKSNPAKTQDIYFVSIMNQDGLEYGVDRRTPVTYTFSAKEPKKAYRSFGLPFNVTSNPKFQEFAKRNKTIIASLNEIIEMMQGFAK